LAQVRNLILAGDDKNVKLIRKAAEKSDVQQARRLIFGKQKDDVKNKEKNQADQNNSLHGKNIPKSVVNAIVENPQDIDCIPEQHNVAEKFVFIHI